MGFNIRTVLRHKEEQYMIIKGSTKDEITILSIYAPNIGAPRYLRQMLTAIKGEMNSNITIVGDFNTPLTSVDRASRQKINKEIQALNDTLDQMNLIDFYRVFHMKAEKYTFLQLHMEHSPG